MDDGFGFVIGTMFAALVAIFIIALIAESVYHDNRLEVLEVHSCELKGGEGQLIDDKVVCWGVKDEE